MACVLTAPSGDYTLCGTDTTLVGIQQHISMTSERTFNNGSITYKCALIKTKDADCDITSGYENVKLLVNKINSIYLFLL